MLHRHLALFCAIALAGPNTGSGSGGRTPPASGATDPATTQAGTNPAGSGDPVTPTPTAHQPQVGESQLSDIATAPTPTGPADEVEEARPLAGDWAAKQGQIFADATAELRAIATDNGDHDTTIRLNALADKMDHQYAQAQAPTA